jgi:hypothetical protein
MLHPADRKIAVRIAAVFFLMVIVWSLVAVVMFS